MQLNRSRNVQELTLEKLLAVSEEEIVEFKAARNNYSFDRLREYCVAIANEGGGVLVLGITDQSS